MFDRRYIPKNPPLPSLPLHFKVLLLALTGGLLKSAGPGQLRHGLGIVGEGRALPFLRRVGLQLFEQYFHRFFQLRIVPFAQALGENSTSISGGTPWFSTSHSSL